MTQRSLQIPAHAYMTAQLRDLMRERNSIQLQILLIQAHFCQNQLQSISLYVKPQSCHKDTTHRCNAISKKCCEKKEVPDKDDCCHNTFDFKKLDLDQYLFKYFLIDKKIDFVGILNYQNFQLPTSPFQQKVKFYNYKPPLIEFDLQPMYQVFLC